MVDRRSNVKLVLDENLSTKIAELLRTEGVDIIHLRERRMLGATDHAVLDKAFQEDRVLVTMNVADFEKLAAARDVHAGIVLVTPGGLLRAEQLVIVRAALAHLDGIDMVNRVLRADLDGSMTFEDLPPAR